MDTQALAVGGSALLLIATAAAAAACLSEDEPDDPDEQPPKRRKKENAPRAKKRERHGEPLQPYREGRWFRAVKELCWWICRVAAVMQVCAQINRFTTDKDDDDYQGEWHLLTDGDTRQRPRVRDVGPRRHRRGTGCRACHLPLRHWRCRP